MDMPANQKPEKIIAPENYAIYPLTRQIAARHVEAVLHFLNDIPMKTYTWEEVLAESRPDRKYYGKWDHSLIAFDRHKPIAVLIAYERETEAHPCYRDNSIYISELAVDKSYRRKGIAKQMLDLFFRRSSRFLHLEGEPVYTIQTNAAAWNEPVKKLYEACGYKTVGTKKYPDRNDVIMKKQ
jgi:ribosomal protein S18 acetylase RimI-like enzyme